MQRSSVEWSGNNEAEPDYIYYNAQIINNETRDGTANSVGDPQIRFNETRDAPIVKDASKYHFSVVRFTMNGPGLDLPLFIPTIQLGQPDINKTAQEMALTQEQTWATSLGNVSFTVLPPVRNISQVPETQNQLAAPLPPPPITVQDLNTNQYWVQTLQHWVDLWNKTMLDPLQLATPPTTLPANSTCCVQDTFIAFYAQWLAAGLNPVGVAPNPFPQATLADFLAGPNGAQPPKLVQDPQSKLFTLWFDSQAVAPNATNSVYAQRLTSFTPTGQVPGPPEVVGGWTQPIYRLFFDTNMQGLFANFDNTYWNTTSATSGPFPGFAAPVGQVNEILCPNKNYTNVVDQRLPPQGGVPPLGFVPTAEQTVWYTQSQDWLSTSQIWSPIESIVFSSTLLPVRSEQTGPPTELGTGDLGQSAPVASAAFQPIVTDLCIDTSADGAWANKTFTIYNPTAEQRVSDFGPSKQEIRNIDVQVFWRNRLNNQLYPIRAFNQSSISFKLLFRHRGL